MPGRSAYSMVALTAILCSAAGLLFHRSAGAQTAEKTRVPTERLVGPFTYAGGKDPLLRTSLFPAPEGRGIAFARREGRRWRVYMDGQTERVFDGLELKDHFAPNARRAVKVWRGPVYSADGRKHVFAARLRNRWFMIRDGVALENHRFAREARLSADGKHLAYIARGRRGEFVVHDGKNGPTYRRIEALLLSPDGKHTAYIALKRRRVRVMVLDGREDIPRPNPRKAIFSPAGGELAYVAGAKGRESIVRARMINGVPQFTAGRTHQFVGRFVFSPDGKRTAYLAMDGGKRRFLIDGLETPTYQFCYHFSFSPDSKRHAYVAAGSEGMFVVLDGKASTAYKHVILPLDKNGRPRFFSPDGRWAYKAGEDDQEFVITDRGRSKPYDTVNPSPWGPPYLAPGSGATVFAARFDERAFIIFGDAQSRKYDAVRGPILAGKRMAFIAKHEGRMHIVRGSKLISAHDDISYIKFGPDKKRVLALARRGDKRLVDVDGRPGRLYDAIIGKPRFTNADEIAYYGVRDGNVYAVTEKIDYPPPADDPIPVPVKKAPAGDKKPAADKKAPVGDKKEPADKKPAVNEKEPVKKAPAADK